MKLGATGKFPEGKINEEDEGELRMAIAYDSANDAVILDFGKPVKWVGMPPDQAIAFANMIIKRATARK